MRSSMQDMRSPWPLQAPGQSGSVKDGGCHQGVALAAALDGVPIAALLQQSVASWERGDPEAEQDMRLILVLLEQWLHHFELDIAAFPEAAVPVLQQQKAQLQATHAALAELYQGLLAWLAGTPPMGLGPALHATELGSQPLPAGTRRPGSTLELSHSLHN